MIASNLFLVSSLDFNFEENYVLLRNQELRLYSDELLTELPTVPKNHPHHKEWKLRTITLRRFINYLGKKHSESDLLDLGCGNGWFTNCCSKYVKSAIGVDINMTELKQASRVFSKKNLIFYYWDIFSDISIDRKFDIIVLNASIQYFENLQNLFEKLKLLLKKGGEIHLLDSPFYERENLNAAVERSRAYYKKIGFPQMQSFYFHHSKEKIIQEGFEVKHKGEKIRLLRLVKGESPFSWFLYKEK